MRNVPMEKLMFLLQHLEGYIENAVYEVLVDSEEYPQYSAVTATNLIKCHIEVEEALKFPFSFLAFCGMIQKVLRKGAFYADDR